MKKAIAIVSILSFFFGFAVNENNVDAATKKNSQNDKTTNTAARDEICIQVITSAISPSGECSNFPTPCDVPEDWTRVIKCEMAKTIIEKRKREAIEKYVSTKKEFENSEEFYNAAKENFLEAKEEFIKEKSEAAGKKLQEKIEEFLDKSISSMTKYLESLKNRVKNIHFVSENDREKIIAEIDNDIEALNEKLDEVKNAETLEEQKTLAEEIKFEWKNIRTTSKKITGQLFAAKINYLISKLETSFEKLQKADIDNSEIENEGDVLSASDSVVEEKIEDEQTEDIENEEADDEEESEDKDSDKENNLKLIQNIQELSDDFIKNIGFAKEQNEFAEEKFSQIKTTEQAKTLFNEGMQYIKKAHRYLMFAHLDLIRISQTIKKNRKKEPEENGNGTEETGENAKKTEETQATQ